MPNIDKVDKVDKYKVVNCTVAGLHNKNTWLIQIHRYLCMSGYNLTLPINDYNKSKYINTGRIGMFEIPLLVTFNY